MRWLFWMLMATWSLADAEECKVLEDGSQVCQPDGEDDVPTPLSGMGVGFAGQGDWEDKPIEELRKDPQWLETARKNNVIVDPEERARLEAMFEEEDSEVTIGGDTPPEDNSNKLQFGVIERTPERKALNRYEDGGNIVYSNLECYDISESCSILLERNPDACGDVTLPEPESPATGRMRIKCKVSCKLCEPSEDNKPESVPHTTIGEFQTNDGNVEERNKVNKVLSDMIHYLRDVVLVEQGYSRMYQECQNKHALCAFWASMDECDNNPRFMRHECNLACMSCDEHELYISSPIA